jgi:hypothetical protein
MRRHPLRSWKWPSSKPSGRAIALDGGRGLQGESPPVALLPLSPSGDRSLFLTLLTLVRRRRVLGSSTVGYVKMYSLADAPFQAGAYAEVVA